MASEKYRSCQLPILFGVGASSAKCECEASLGLIPTGKTPKCSESSLAECHVFCHRTHIGWAEVDPGPRDDETPLLDRRLDVMRIRALSVFLLLMYFPFSIRPLVCSILRISVVFLVLKVLAYFSVLLTNF